MEVQLIGVIKVIVFLAPLVAVIAAAVWLVRLHMRGPSVASKSKWKPAIPFNKLNVDQGQLGGRAH